MYLQVREDGIITDCIEYQHEGYVEYLGDIPLFVHGGWHKLVNGEIIEITELNPTTIENKIKSALDDYTLSLIEMGVL